MVSGSKLMTRPALQWFRADIMELYYYNTTQYIHGYGHTNWDTHTTTTAWVAASHFATSRAHVHHHYDNMHEIHTRLARAIITFPRLLRLLLMLCVSFSLSQRLPLFPSLSEPARSTRFNVPGESTNMFPVAYFEQYYSTNHLPWQVSIVLLLEPDRISRNRQWLREERSLHSVAATALFLMPVLRRWAT